MKTNEAPLDFLKSLGDIKNISASTGNILPNGDNLFINTHIHLPPNFSAFESVEQAVNLAAEQGIKILGVGNYYDFSVYRNFAQAALGKGIFPLFNTEIIALEKDLQEKGIRVNDPGNPGKYYVCGKGITKFFNQTDKAKRLLDIIRKNDSERMRLMTEKLAKHFADFGIETGLDDKAIIELIINRHKCSPESVVPQERHLALAFQQKFFKKVDLEKRKNKLSEILNTLIKSKPDDPIGIQNEIRSNLMKTGKPCYVPETFVSLAQAKELILELGGIPCYPVVADCTDPLCEYEATPEILIENLKHNNYSIVEFITVRNSPEVLKEYVIAIRDAGIAVLAGTEHNTLDMLTIEPVCSDGKAIPKDIIEIFTEGAMVVAAHQYLSANGKCGFVDENGLANPDYEDAEERIKAFKKIGEAVLHKYFSNNKAEILTNG
ncbi:MAG: hypothetical protein JW804_04730 [Sedimentisphaerales bacterium]|nr:hypothetical protein [Sedimentisphaerales bacterium]